MTFTQALLWIAYHSRLPGEPPKRQWIKSNYELSLHRPKDFDAIRMVDESVQINNNERPHLSLKYKTPDAVHRAF